MWDLLTAKTSHFAGCQSLQASRTVSRSTFCHPSQSPKLLSFSPFRISIEGCAAVTRSEAPGVCQLDLPGYRKSSDEEAETVCTAAFARARRGRFLRRMRQLEWLEPRAMMAGTPLATVTDALATAGTSREIGLTLANADRAGRPLTASAPDHRQHVQSGRRARSQPGGHANHADPQPERCQRCRR